MVMVVVELLTPHPTESREAELCSPSEAGATSDWTLVSEHPQGWGGGGGAQEPGIANRFTEFPLMWLCLHFIP